MKSKKFKNYCFLKKVSQEQLLKLPTPSSISYNWNFGSLLGINFFLQICTGVFMSMYYDPNLDKAFSSVIYLMNDVNLGWLIRFLHANGATSFFFLMYIHIARNFYYKSYLNSPFTWASGIFIFFLFMASAFLGYVLPWGQMSYWGATVITNLISALPYLGSFLVEWIWGGFSVGNPTLTRFFSLHYLTPLLSSFFVFFHLFFLHETGSSNPLGLGKNSDKVFFHPYFTMKDYIGFVLFFFFISISSLKFPTFFMDSDNFMIANPMTTPVHIQPEWYFLFAYTILRSVPTKLGGVFALLMSIFILMFFPFLGNKQKKKSSYFNFFCFFQFFIFLVLTFIGMMPVEAPFFFIGFIFSNLYFYNLSFLLIL